MRQRLSFIQHRASFYTFISFLFFLFVMWKFELFASFVVIVKRHYFGCTLLLLLFFFSNYVYPRACLKSAENAGEIR